MTQPYAVGQRFGYLTIVQAAGTDGARNARTLWITRCECGKERTFRSDQIKQAGKQCSHHNIKGQGHRQRWPREYEIWVGMRHRCRNPNHKDFKYYGARGIKVCERWDSFENFLADMGAVPPGLTIDRINNDGNYEPGNCRWATRLQQSQNRSHRAA